MIVAEAEAKAHGLPIDQVHFHEVGAIDSIIDIVSVAVCVDNLGIEDVVVSPLAEGRGHVHCAHGILSVPVPATANIASAYGLELRLTDSEGEMVTPTGAAIAAALRTRKELPDSCRLLKIGMGAGNKEFRHANVLRAMLLEADETAVGEVLGVRDSTADSDQQVKDPVADEAPQGRSLTADEDLWVMEANLDDCTGEMLGFVMELLLEQGAADVWYTPIFMKKNRPAYTISVLYHEKDREKLEDILFVQTTTIGIRRYPVQRTALPRGNHRAETKYGTVDVKICSYKGKTYCYPEYESVRSICKASGADFQTVYGEAKRNAEMQTAE